MAEPQKRQKRKLMKKYDPDFVSFSVRQSRKVESLEDNILDELNEPKKKKARLSIGGESSRSGLKSEEPGDPELITPLQTLIAQSKSADVELKNCKISACAQRPICFVRSGERCSGIGYSSRWHHVSKGEHFCNSCFEHFYRSAKPGYDEYMDWKKMWTPHSNIDGSLRTFLADRYLPYWIKCTECAKWRQVAPSLNPSAEFFDKFVCGMKTQGKLKNNTACSLPEDERVSAAKEYSWISTLMEPPFLRQSPAAPFLVNYYPDGVGLSPCDMPHITTLPDTPMKSGSSSELSSTDFTSDDDSPKKDSPSKRRHKLIKPIVEGVPEHIEPFVQPESIVQALAFRPNMMDEHELEAFAEYGRNQLTYLGLRNTCLALWAKGCKSVLTVEKVMRYVVCRGLVRVRCEMELERIIIFLTLRGVINIGLLQDCPEAGLLPPQYNKLRIIIIGAGFAGLAAAKQLHNFGCKNVCILEARDRIGGRIEDDTSMGVCVGRGAHMLLGTTNNPIITLAYQCGEPLRNYQADCKVLNEDGELFTSSVDQRIDFHFNALLDNVGSWRQRDKTTDKDLLSKIKDMHRQFVEESHLRFSQSEDKLVNFHISNLEFACGSPLSQVSAKYWDQNEQYPQFTGQTCALINGYTSVLKPLSQGLDIRYGQEVISIDYDKEIVIVKTTAGEEMVADRVLVTLPLSLLQKGKVQFIPPLPEAKVEAIKKIGIGKIEKVILKFDEKFWKKKLNGVDKFGCVPSCDSDRGLFPVFYDMSPEDEKIAVLMTHIVGEAVELYAKTSDEDIRKMVITKLRKIFPEQQLPDPVKCMITRWSCDPLASMSYSFLPVDCQGTMYDQLAEEIHAKVYFAGEATNRQFPQSVTGAYISGIREAEKLALASSHLAELTE